MNGVNRQRCCTGLLTRLADRWPNRRIDGPMPWYRAPTNHG
jgi:hypothetical protein